MCYNEAVCQRQLSINENCTERKAPQDGNLQEGEKRGAPGDLTESVFAGSSSNFSVSDVVKNPCPSVFHTFAYVYLFLFFS